MAVKWYLLPRDTDWNRYWDSHSIDAERVYTRTEYPRLLEIFTTYLRPDDVFFEGGCGLGRWLHYLKEQGHQKLIGLDFTVQPIMKS